MISLKKMILAVGFLGISSAFSAQIFQNQIGFLPESQKQVVLKEGSNSPVVIKDQSGTEVLSVTPGEEAFWAPANESVKIVDFSSLKTPGVYFAYQDNNKISHEIIINKKACMNNQPTSAQAHTLMALLKMNLFGPLPNFTALVKTQCTWKT